MNSSQMSSSSDSTSEISRMWTIHTEDEAETQAIAPPTQSNESDPLLTSIESRDGTWSPYLKDLHLLSFSFLFIFLAFGAAQNLESSLLEDKGLGSTCLGVLYLSLTVSSMGAPIVVMWLGSRNALLFGQSGYWLFIIANLFPSWYTLIPASTYLGFTASVLWVAEGTYLTCAAKHHAALCNLPEAAALGIFNGEFWAVYSCQAIGNLLSLALLEDQKSFEQQNIKSSAPPVKLFLVFLGSMAIGTLLTFFLRHQSVVNEEGSSADASTSRRGNCIASFTLTCERRMLLLISLLIYTGLQQAFIWSDFTRDVVTPTLGLYWVGGVMAAYDASRTIASVIAGRYSSGYRSISIILTGGSCCQILVLVVLFVNTTLEGEYYFIIVFGAAILWGIGDACYNTQISAVLGILYAHKLEVAFAQWRIWGSAATAAAFFASASTTFLLKIVVLFVHPDQFFSFSMFLFLPFMTELLCQAFVLVRKACS